jgi:hypothetical protein
MAIFRITVNVTTHVAVQGLMLMRMHIKKSQLKVSFMVLMVKMLRIGNHYTSLVEKEGLRWLNYL